MTRFNLYIRTITLVLGTTLMLSCSNSANQADKETTSSKEKISVTIEAENYHKVDGLTATRQVDKENIQTLQIAKDGWIALDASIPVAGRYKVEIRAMADTENTTNVWVEDYYDNKDNRTYNITGNISINIEKDKLDVYGKIGSPMNKGLHKIKIHTDEPLKLDWIKFTLIKKHRKTPEALVQNTEGDSWEIVWADEFEGETIDTSKWTYDIGNWGWGNAELQYYTDSRKKNARIENGNLIIEAHKNDMGEKWTSARLTTREKTSFQYGKIEFKAIVPAKKGNWAAGWTLGDDYVDELSWPYCGEIDILESVGYEMDNETGNGIAHASAHSGAYYFKLNNQPTATIPVDSMNQKYHTYAVEWTPEYIKAMVDDKVYFEYNDNSTELSWPFDKPHNIILNLAMGGGWGGAQGMDPDVTSQKMIIDYVRVYERK